MPVGSKRQVMNGTATKTPGGLTKSDIKTCKKDGQTHYVSKKKSAVAKSNFSGWLKAVKSAKKELDIPKHDFVLLKKSSALYKAAAAIYYK
jgi:hypothetical protein